jgi:hypothetical protein
MEIMACQTGLPITGSEEVSVRHIQRIVCDCGVGVALLAIIHSDFTNAHARVFTVAIHARMHTDGLAL